MSKRLFGFAYSAESLKFLRGLQKKIRKQIVGKIELLAADPYPQGHKMIQGMSGNEERVYRIRSGDYRVLYVVRDKPDHIVVLDIGHRKDIYK